MSKTAPTVIGPDGAVVRLGKVLGQGGEGAVYELTQRPDLVAKLYHKPLSIEKAAKLKAMASIASTSLESFTAWPAGLLTQADRRPIGILMPKISGRKDVHHLYTPKSRRGDFQRADWRFLIRVAINTAKAFGSVHSANCVIGDVNHGGVLVGQDATVKLIDCDSFQVRAGSDIFFCEVGVETYTPPELQRRSFSGIIRTPNHDNFGLAVMAFLLLFMGRHPFSGRFLGKGEMQIAQAIEEVRFPYGQNHNLVQMNRPPGMPTLLIAGPTIADLFERAFSRHTIASGRPTASEWVAGLSKLETELKLCSANPAHWHHSSTSCPWCPMEGLTGVPLFGVVIHGDVKSFEISTLWNQILSIPNPGPAPSLNFPEAQPSQQALEFTSRKRKHLHGGLLVTSGMIGAMIFSSSIFAFLMVALALVITYSWKKLQAELNVLMDHRKDAETKWLTILQHWTQRAGPTAYTEKRQKLDELRRGWDSLAPKRVARLEQLKRDQRHLQLNRFLDQFEIDTAKIDGIGAGRKQTLISFNIETALDITSSAIEGVPGFGPKTQQKLLDWRRSIEARFVFDPNRAVDPKDIQRVELDIAAERKTIEQKLLQAAAELRQTVLQINSAREHLRPQVEAAWTVFSQAKADAAQ